MDYSWVLVAVLGIAFLPDLFDNNSDSGNGQGDSGDGGSGDDGGSMDGIDDLLGDGGTDGGNDTDDGDDQTGDDSGGSDDMAVSDDADSQDTEQGDGDRAGAADSDAKDVPDTSNNGVENGGDAGEGEDVQLVHIDADGAADPVEVADFTIGEDILSISMNPDAVEGTLGVDVQNSPGGEDSMVYVEQELMAILRGTPNATAEDVMVALVKMAA